MSYIDTIKEKARSDRKTIVMPETNDKRTLIAAAHVLQEGIANIIMVGNEEKIMEAPAGWKWIVTGVTVIDPNKTDKLDEYVEILTKQEKQGNDHGKGKGDPSERSSDLRCGYGKGQ